MEHGHKKDKKKKDGKKWFDLPTHLKNDYKVYDFSVPITVKPYAITYEPEISCLGDLESCPGHKEYDGKHKSINFTITQKIALKTPIEFGVKECVDELCVEESEHEE